MAAPLISAETRVRWTVGPVITSTADAALRGLVKWGELVLAESNSTVPHDSGDLERSGVVIPHRSDLAVTVSYDTPYAVTQHEALDLTHEPGRGPKFLENSVMDNAAKGLRIVANEISGALS